LFQSLQLWPVRIEFSDAGESKLVKIHKSFMTLINDKISKFPSCCLEFPPSIGGVFFSKETFLKYIRILNREVLNYLGNFERVNLTTTENHVFSFFFLKIFRMKINSEILEHQIDKLMFEFENLAKYHKTNPFLNQNPTPNLGSHGICIVQILDQKKKRMVWLNFLFQLEFFLIPKKSNILKFGSDLKSFFKHWL